MRRIEHPGPADSERMTAIAGSAVPLRFVLEPGLAVDAAIAAGLTRAGCIGGFVEFRGGRCEPFRYVMPAASSDPRYVAWYSETFEPVGPVNVERACAIIGVRDGKIFLHCHGIWETSEGKRMGHMLAPLCRVAETIEVSGIGFKDATFEAMPDMETNFTLFEPVRSVGSRPLNMNAQVLLARIRPNQDISIAIEGICLQHGIERAKVYGIGSLNGVHFSDGSQLESHATEVLIHDGRLEDEDGQARARLAIDVVDMNGVIASGVINRGDNPVCVTFELVIKALGG
ncbi:putative DNA-binding protein with PD1-like motif [Microvirga lupini]|uniref:Putative DNA-binding protein with PD1-like motif n=1 Tax=Microvirga lupini TaxID=420324 RepID=A0A7W4YVT3_9HYPH|nr:DUF296 domain-containing protein [Microvirga lupini]MBB3018156.1 putative DNA-binding protein with PD1-like motif [Microvirga lupini]